MPLTTFKELEPWMENYVWRTMLDHKVRPTHMANEGRIFSLVQEPFPPMGYPGTEPFCRCQADPVMGEIEDMDMTRFIKMDDVSTWPKPPIDGMLKEGLPTRSKARKRGEKRLYDQYGGEWRIHMDDQRHYIHWDYMSTAKWDGWLDISINNLPTRKPTTKSMNNKMDTSCNSRIRFDFKCLRAQMYKCYIEHCIA